MPLLPAHAAVGELGVAANICRSGPMKRLAFRAALSDERFSHAGRWRLSEARWCYVAPFIDRAVSNLVTGVVNPRRTDHRS